MLGGQVTAERPGDAGSAQGPKPTRIENRVIDLLDERVTLMNSVDEYVGWTSEPFDTSQYTWVGLRMTGDVAMATSTLWCQVSWRYTPEDDFLPGGPHATDGFQVIGDDTGTVVIDPPPSGIVLPSPAPFTYVGGLQGRVSCGANRPRNGAGSGTLTDVKILLRR
jgi:hypothetical protein